MAASKIAATLTIAKQWFQSLCSDTSNNYSWNKAMIGKVSSSLWHNRCHMVNWQYFHILTHNLNDTCYSKVKSNRNNLHWVCISPPIISNGHKISGSLLPITETVQDLHWVPWWQHPDIDEPCFPQFHPATHARGCNHNTSATHARGCNRNTSATHTRGCNRITSVR